MQALHIGTVMKVAGYSFPIFGTKFIYKLLELVIFLLRPPSFLDIELIEWPTHGGQVTRIIDDTVH